MMSAYFLADIILQINKKNCMTTSESKGRFFLQNESIRISNWNALLWNPTLSNRVWATFTFLRLGSCCLNGGGESS